MDINWYPGHMAKAKRDLTEQIKRVDVVVEMIDARIPRSSRNPDLKKLTGRRKSLLVMNKTDLAEEGETRRWLERFRQEGETCTAVDLNRGAAPVLRGIEELSKEAVERALARQIRKTVRVMVIGVPNVGKSTLINRLARTKSVTVADRPGVTRSNHWVRISPYMELLDSPGLLWPRLDDPDCARRLAYIAAVRDQVVDTYALAGALLKDLCAIAPDRVAERYKIKDPAAGPEELLEQACLGRGFLLKGGVADIDRGAAVVLDEFRAGRLGRLTLEKCPERIGNDENEP